MQTTNPLSESDVLRFLQQQHQRGRPSPTLREIAAHVGHKATLSVQRILNRLEQQGLIRREAQQGAKHPADGQGVAETWVVVDWTDCCWATH